MRVSSMDYIIYWKYKKDNLHTFAAIASYKKWHNVTFAHEFIIKNCIQMSTFIVNFSECKV